MIIGIVGPCGAGKSSLVASIKSLGFQARHIAQEHSYVPDMWKRMTHPDVLIYLDVSYENTILRRKLDWTLEEYQEQVRRLRHARQFADYYIDTNLLSLDDVRKAALAFIHSVEQSSLSG